MLASAIPMARKKGTKALTVIPTVLEETGHEVCALAEERARRYASPAFARARQGSREELQVERESFSPARRHTVEANQ